MLATTTDTIAERISDWAHESGWQFMLVLCIHFTLLIALSTAIVALTPLPSVACWALGVLCQALGITAFCWLLDH